MPRECRKRPQDTRPYCSIETNQKKNALKMWRQTKLWWTWSCKSKLEGLPLESHHLVLASKPLHQQIECTYTWPTKRQGTKDRIHLNQGPLVLTLFHGREAVLSGTESIPVPVGVGCGHISALSGGWDLPSRPGGLFTERPFTTECLSSELNNFTRFSLFLQAGSLDHLNYNSPGN